MKMTMKTHGMQGVATEMRSIGERVPDAARKAMHRAAARVIKDAKQRAPVDGHNLEDAIHVEKTYGERGRLQIDVVVGGFVDGRNVDDYAAAIHEGEGTTWFHLGPKSQEKQRTVSVRVGGKFLEDAAKQEDEKLERYMIEAVTEEINN